MCLLRLPPLVSPYVQLMGPFYPLRNPLIYLHLFCYFNFSNPITKPRLANNHPTGFLASILATPSPGHEFPTLH